MRPEFKLISSDGSPTIETRLTGKALLSVPQLNKGTAFTLEERKLFKLSGKLPSRVETIEDQIKRAYAQFTRYETSIEKNIYLNELHDTNQVLFYRLVLENLEEMIPMIYTPTVGDAVINYSEEFRRPRGLYIAYEDRFEIREILKNRTNPEVDIIVTTDSEGVLGIGDQGIGGMCIPIAKLMVYSLCGGLNPAKHLPIYLDVGTNNQKLLDDPLYLGARHPRISGEQYDEFIGLFVEAVRAEFPHIFLHWEDFGRENARKNLDRYKDKMCTFNDDMQGTAAVALAALLSATKAAQLDFIDQRIVILGAGTAGVGIADQIKASLIQHGLSEKEALACFWLVDRQGLLVEGDQTLLDFQQPYARPVSEVSHWDKNAKGVFDLAEVVRRVGPTTLIGCSTCHGAFKEDIIKTMAQKTLRPIIFPLSNPTPLAEADPNDLLLWTEGKALIATGSPFPDVSYRGRKVIVPQCNNALVFPGLGAGIVAVKARRLTDNMLFAACHSLANASPVHKNANAPILPPLREALEISFHIAEAVAKQAIQDGVADEPKEGVTKALEKIRWSPSYPILKLAPTPEL
jgi:malate dehydrogenase (oxaloacetate-decarboxylating)